MTTHPSFSGRGAYIPVALRDLNRLGLLQNVQKFFLVAGWRLQKRGDNGIAVRSDAKTVPLLEAAPLLGPNDEPLPDALERLNPDKFALDRGIDEVMRQERDRGLRPGSALMEFQIDLLSNTEPFAELARVAKRDRLSLWAIRTTDAFRRRLLLYEVFDYLIGGNDPSQFRQRPRVANPMLKGLIELQPASTVCAVLAARSQPLVAVLLTPYLSQVVLVPKHGAFGREASAQPWPVAFSRISFHGSDRDAYRTPLTHFPEGHGEEALSAMVAGADRLFDQLTRPENWSDGATLDLNARLVAWGSIRFGLDAITALAADWTSQEAIWTAFRALTTLQGIWDCQLSDLLDPARLEAHAVPLLFNPAEQSWAGGLVANYRNSFAAAFPGRSPGTVAVKLAHIRNLVHGLRAEGQDPMVRLEIIRTLEQAGPSLELVRDIASLWWTAAVLSPQTHARPGIPPWRRPKQSQPAPVRAGTPEARVTSNTEPEFDPTADPNRGGA